MNRMVLLIAVAVLVLIAVFGGLFVHPLFFALLLLALVAILA